ncbi:MAG TPA: hypothetical protein VFE71_03075 [Bacteroidales bacterium]|nr:hypothetical protein [Bacteroidales bacterium]
MIFPSEFLIRHLFPNSLKIIYSQKAILISAPFEFIFVTFPIYVVLIEYFQQEFDFHFFGFKCKDLGNRYSNIEINNPIICSSYDDLGNSSIKDTKSDLQKDEGFKILGHVSYIFAISAIYVIFLTPYIVSTGNINVKMDNIYYTDVTHIPIQIIETGQITNTTINLSKKDAEGNVSVLDYIIVHPDNSDRNEVVTGKYLRVSTFDYGKYEAFIDTTNLMQGYYDLSFSEEFPVNKTTFDSFYLKK